MKEQFYLKQLNQLQSTIILYHNLCFFNMKPNNPYNRCILYGSLCQIKQILQNTEQKLEQKKYLHYFQQIYNLFYINLMEIYQYEQCEIEDLQTPLKIMKKLNNTQAFRFIDDLNRKASEDLKSTNRSSGSNSNQSFKQSKTQKSSLHGHMQLRFDSEDANYMQNFQGKIINGTFPLGRSTSRKIVSIQKKRSSAYPLNGDGFTKLPDGRVVFAVWHNGKITGNAKIMYPSSSIYVGQVKDYLKHGAGVLTLKNGEKYVGSFVNDKCQGYGIKYDVYGNVSYEGIWKEGMLIKMSY